MLGPDRGKAERRVTGNDGVVDRAEADATEAAIRRLVTEAGFTRFRRAAETPFNLVYEVRP